MFAGDGLAPCLSVSRVKNITFMKWRTDSSMSGARCTKGTPDADSYGSEYVSGMQHTAQSDSYRPDGVLCKISGTRSRSTLRTLADWSRQSPRTRNPSEPMLDKQEMVTKDGVQYARASGSSYARCYPDPLRRVCGLLRPSFLCA